MTESEKNEIHAHVQAIAFCHHQARSLTEPCR